MQLTERPWLVCCCANGADGSSAEWDPLSCAMHTIQKRVDKNPKKSHPFFLYCLMRGSQSDEHVVNDLQRFSHKKIQLLSNSWREKKEASVWYQDTEEGKHTESDHRSIMLSSLRSHCCFFLHRMRTVDCVAPLLGRKSLNGRHKGEDLWRQPHSWRKCESVIKLFLSCIVSK